MNIHEFGKENRESILLIHPSVVKWDYFEYVIPLLEKNYHLIVPALPGYDFEDDSDFTSVEQIAAELNAWLKAKGYEELYAVYGCSMGGSVALMVTQYPDQALCHGRRHHAVSASVAGNALYRVEGLSDDAGQGRRCGAAGKGVRHRRIFKGGSAIRGRRPQALQQENPVAHIRFVQQLPRSKADT